jgi:CheY-like chemotaxis protein
MKLLIADDLATQRLVLSMTLKKLGHTFAAAEDGKRAWEYYQQEHFPIVVTDWQMPDMDGLDLCRMIRSRPYEQYTYIIVLTTLDSRLNYLEAIEAGADDFLVKPFEEDLLAARLLVAQRIGSLLTEAKQIQGLLPICPECKKIRAENDQWMKVDQFITSHTKATVHQGTCPECNKFQQEKERRLLKDLRTST